MEFKVAMEDDIELLTASRMEVLKAANKLDDSIDMTAVEIESRKYYQKALAEGTHFAILVMNKGIFIGAGGVSFYTVMPTYHNPSGKKAYIMNMYTNPNYRRRGIAYKTLDMLVHESKQRGVHHITLEATDEGRPLYEKYGFVQMQTEMKFICSE